MDDPLPLITAEVAEAMRAVEVSLALIDSLCRATDDRTEWDDLHDELDAAMAQLQQATWRIEDWRAGDA